MEIIRHDTARAFLDRAETWLMRSEAEHNLILGIAYRLGTSTGDYEPPLYFVTVEEEGEIVGCAIRTPPFKLSLTRMPEAAIMPLVKHVSSVHATLPAVMGPRREAGWFADLWPVPAEPGMRQRIYQATRITPPDPRPPGRLRPCVPQDLDLLTDWIEAFHIDAGVSGRQARAGAEDMITRQTAYFWLNPEPVCLAGWMARTPNGVRIGPVYTPSECRRRGYASAAVAVLSQQMLDSGLRFCFLYTDLSNPTSNRIYAHVGYEPVCDAMDYDFAS